MNLVKVVEFEHEGETLVRFEGGRFAHGFPGSKRRAYMLEAPDGFAVDWEAAQGRYPVTEQELEELMPSTQPFAHTFTQGAQIQREASITATAAVQHAQSGPSGRFGFRLVKAIEPDAEGVTMTVPS